MQKLEHDMRLSKWRQDWHLQELSLSDSHRSVAQWFSQLLKELLEACDSSTVQACGWVDLLFQGHGAPTNENRLQSAALFIAMETIRQNWDAAATSHTSCVPWRTNLLSFIQRFYGSYKHMWVHISMSVTVNHWRLCFGPFLKNTLHYIFQICYSCKPVPKSGNWLKKTHANTVGCVPGAWLSLRILFVYHHTLSLGPCGLCVFVCGLLLMACWVHHQ